MSTARRRVVIARCSFPSLEIEQRVLGAVGAEIIDGRRASDEELTQLCRQADAVITDYFELSREQIERMEKCRVICQYGVGLDQIDIDAATDCGIVVTHTPDFCTDEVADHTLALILCLWRKILSLHNSVISGRWDYNVAEPIFRIRGSMLGLIGFGRIGRNLATKAKAVGFTIVMHDPLVDRSFARSLGVEPLDLSELLCRSDVISLHTPLTKRTRHLIGARELGMMKRTSLLVNSSRGGLIDQQALTEALVNGQLAGAALDVLEPEPPAPGELLLGLPGIIVTPHVAFFSRESLQAVQTQAAEAVAMVLSGKRPPILVNPQVLELQRL